MSSTRDWDASTYDRVSGPQLEWGAEVLARLPLRGDEVVLDAGCGSGRVTELLLDRLPRGRVVAVDGSPSMVELARQRLDARAEVICADLLELSLKHPLDAIISTATFHWIADHDRLFGRLFAALDEGGRIEAQCGGEGNVDEFVVATLEVQGETQFAPHLEAIRKPWNFAAPGETEERLRRVGFVDVNCWLERKLVRPSSPHEFTMTAGLGPQLDLLPADLHAPFVDAVLERLPSPLELAYVRLNISARKPCNSGISHLGSGSSEPLI